MGLRTGVTVRELSKRYRFLVRELQPKKHVSKVTGMTSEEAVELFKLVNNVQQIMYITVST